MRPRALITEPCFEICTCYWYYAIENHLWRYAPLWSWSVLRLRKGDAIRSVFERAISEFDPQLVVIGGHGSPREVTGQNMVPLTWVCDDALVGRIAFVFSCDTAAQLGPDAVRKGCRAYIGWRKPLVFIARAPPMPRDPADDPYAWPLFDAALSSVGALMWGKSAGEALRIFVERCRYWAQRYASRPGGAHVAAYLLYDASIAVCMGDIAASVSVKVGSEPFATMGGGILSILSALLPMPRRKR